VSVRSFRPVIAVASVAAAALSCYLVSLRVATERASLEDVETKIVLAQRDIRTLQTEIGTRGRLEQLERWNVKVLALSAPKADQFLEGSYQLARLTRPSDAVKVDAPVVLASAPKPAPRPLLTDDDADVAAVQAPGDKPASQSSAGSDTPSSMMHVASYRVPAKAAPEARAKASVPASAKPAKIATSDHADALPRAHPDAKASAQHEAAKAGSSKEKATH
jgi:hypothetical protein